MKVMVSRCLCRQVLVLICLAVRVSSFSYTLNNTYNMDRFLLSEGWMYGTAKGPAGAAQGPSFIDAQLKITAMPAKSQESSLNISMMFYRSGIQDISEENINICASRPAVPSYYENELPRKYTKGRFSTSLEKWERRHKRCLCSFASDLADTWSIDVWHNNNLRRHAGRQLAVKIYSFEANPIIENYSVNTEGLYVANIKRRRKVEEGGLQAVFFQVCPTEVVVKSLRVSGKITFHNPYGYLPGMDYGCLPFEWCRVLASIALCAFFTTVMWRHRPTLLPVHYMILGVVVLGTFEAISWLAAYSYMNTTGKPYCCPYPGTVIWAMIMEVLRRTTSRFLLLMICLGYGITRVNLEKRELMAVISLTAAFLASGVLQLASSVAAASKMGSPYEEGSILALPALLTDLVFLAWIYGTLANMIKALKDSNETYKMQMYRALAWTLGTFVSLFVTLSVALLTAQGSQQSWQWKWEWTQVVAWEVLNFCMLAAVSIIWRPTERSAMLAYSRQLATTESGAEDNDCSNVDGVELQAPGVPKQFTIDGGDSDGESPTHRNGAVQQFDDQEVHVAANSPNQEKDGVMYSLANFEPQQHTDLT